MTDRASETVQAVREHAANLAREIADQAALRAVSGAGRARGVGSSIAAGASHRVRDVEQKVGDDIVPSLREVALQAASAALDLWQTARDKAGEAVDFAQEEAGEAAHLIGIGERRAREATSAVVDRVEAAGHKAKDVSAHAAEATVETSKDAGAALLWTGAAAAVVFYVVLSQERREQLLRLVDAVVKQSRELIRDFQGYDEEFA